MTAVDTEGNSMAHAGPTFENPCGRRGCAHIFKYAGTNPFQDLAHLVAQHAPECVGRTCSATGRWEASDEPLDCSDEEEDDLDMCYSFCQPDATDFTYTEKPMAMDDPYLSDEDMDVVMDDFEDELHLESISAPIKGKRTPASNSCATQTFDTHVTANSATTALSAHLPRKKKGARTEAQRRALLESDPWTTIVEPHSVVCRGCEHTIKLDARSRYYPGLWEKHRLRCAGVKESLGEVRLRSTSFTDFVLTESKGVSRSIDESESTASA